MFSLGRPLGAGSASCDNSHTKTKTSPTPTPPSHKQNLLQRHLPNQEEQRLTCGRTPLQYHKAFSIVSARQGAQTTKSQRQAKPDVIISMDMVWQNSQQHDVHVSSKHPYLSTHDETAMEKLARWNKEKETWFMAKGRESMGAGNHHATNKLSSPTRNVKSFQQ